MASDNKDDTNRVQKQQSQNQAAVDYGSNHPSLGGSDYHSSFSGLMNAVGLGGPKTPAQTKKRDNFNNTLQSVSQKYFPPPSSG